jgi:phage I-like protein
MTRPLQTAILAAQALPDAPDGAQVPDWVHLVPSGAFSARDGRGPWRYDDAARVIAESFAARARIHVDLNHSTDTAAKMGLDAPAVGYVTEMEERESGIWARVDWTARGRELLADRAYWGISPVIQFDKKSRRVRAIARAALTNDPAVANLSPLSTKENAMFLSKVAEMLGLDPEAGEDDILAALEKRLADPDDAAPLAALSRIGAAMGLEGDDLSLGELVSAARGLRAAGGEQGEALAALQTEVAELRSAEKRRAASAFVEAAIRDRRAGVAAERETYVALHMENPGRAEKLVAALPKLGETHTGGPAPDPDVSGALGADHTRLAEMLGIDPEKYKARLDADAKAQEAL